MTVRRPTAEEIERIATDIGLSPTPGDIDGFARLLDEALRGYDVVDSVPDRPPEPLYARGAAQPPDPEENPTNAWASKIRVEGANAGPLAGKTVALKDNIMLAGAPMRNGTSLLEGYVPETDATVVTRILAAGGTIVGKAHCEGLCLSGGSHTNFTGAVRNPLRPGYSAGGSSSGCAALVASGEVDLAVGCDQGGSIRMPSSFCGIYGMKPTHGLVPYTGIVPIEPFVDHVGPMTATVSDNALLLETMAGPDGLDPRQVGRPGDRYTDSLDGDARGLRIAMVREGFDRPRAQADVNKKVRAAADMFRRLGAKVEEVSIPWHAQAAAVWLPIGVEGVRHTMMEGDGFGSARSDLYVSSLTDALRRWKERAGELPETVALHLILGVYVHRLHGVHYYGKAMNLTRGVRAAYDQALAEFDLLAMPTTPMKATPLPDANAPREEYHLRATEPTPNTMPFNITHHPAMSMPCGVSDGLPVGMMLVGRHWRESDIYRAAYAFEQADDWRTL
jgi:amidase